VGGGGGRRVRETRAETTSSNNSRISDPSIERRANWLINAWLPTAANRSIQTSLAVRRSIRGQIRLSTSAHRVCISKICTRGPALKESDVGGTPIEQELTIR